ncbi:MAG: chemotaxis protein CheA [Planctomycetota bacterium]
MAHDSSDEFQDARENVDELAAVAVDIEWHDLSTFLPVLTAFETLVETQGEHPALQALREVGVWGVGYMNHLFEEPDLDPSQAGRQVRSAVAALEALVEGCDPEAVTFVVNLRQHQEQQIRLPGEITLPEHVDAELFGEFVSRATSLLEELETNLMSWERSGDLKSRDAAKGMVHTFKGEAGALGIDELEELAHQMEEVIQEGAPPAGAMDALLEAVDWIRAYIAWCVGERAGKPEDQRGLLERLDGRADAGADGDALHPSESVTKGDLGEGLEFSRDPEEMAEFLGEVRDHLENADVQLLELEAGNQDDETLNSLFRSFHTVKGLAGFFGAHIINRVAHETESLLDRTRQGEVGIHAAVTDVVFDAVDIIRQQVQDLKRFVESGEKPTRKVNVAAFAARVRSAMDPDSDVGRRESTAIRADELTAALVASGLVDHRQLTSTVTKHNLPKKDASGMARALVEDGVASARQVAEAMRNARSSQAVTVKESVKVDAARLDHLVDLIGELVIAQSMVTRSVDQAEVGDVQVTAHLSQVGKLTRELQELGTGLRMVPVRGAFQRMARLVRDLSRKLGKPVDFITTGDDTELDKNVVDRIGDPLVHMVRNAIDHGLEADPAQREAAGKSRKGRVELRAFHKGGSIYIEIADDGRGLDRDAILAKARERGLLENGEEPSEREVGQLLFAPGFSTAATVSEVSGRGVGMDVVKRTIESLRGQIEISSEPGRGTCFSIRLPLTLAVIDGMVVRVGDDRYIIPTLSIVTSLRPGAGELPILLERGEMLRWQERLVPMHRLARLFDVVGGESDPTRALCVVVEDEERHVALMVDELLGQQQVVIKALGAGMKKTDGISGGAIMPDGTVGLIVDVMGLVRLADHGERNDDEAAPEANRDRSNQHAPVAAATEGDLL